MQGECTILQAYFLALGQLPFSQAAPVQKQLLYRLSAGMKEAAGSSRRNSAAAAQPCKLPASNWHVAPVPVPLYCYRTCVSSRKPLAAAAQPGMLPKACAVATQHLQSLSCFPLAPFTAAAGCNSSAPAAC
jgi:hypothetical protein